jgi:hypothetical protein
MDALEHLALQRAHHVQDVDHLRAAGRRAGQPTLVPTRVSVVAHSVHLLPVVRHARRPPLACSAASSILLFLCALPAVTLNTRVRT